MRADHARPITHALPLPLLNVNANALTGHLPIA